jgi:AcrR family transcriptional regulator
MPQSPIRGPRSLAAGTPARQRRIVPSPVATLDRRQTLIDAARDLIAERGFEGLRTRDVAERVGLNHATLHHYFATKEALIEAVVLDLVTHLATYRTAQASGDLPAREALRAYLLAARAGVSSDPAPFIALGEFFLRAGRNPRLAAIMRGLETGWTGFFIALLERGQREGAFRRNFDPATVARILVTYLGGVRPPLRDGGAALKREHEQLEAWISAAHGSTARSRRR